MNVAAYESRCSELGIDRGQLAQGFKPGLTSSNCDYEQNENWEVTTKIEKPLIEEDLSRFGSQMTNFSQRQIARYVSRAIPKSRPVYVSIYARKTTPRDIAEKAGVSITSFHSAISGHKKSFEINRRIKPLLTKEELMILGWEK